ncbi:DUF3192 domain-containing protein [Corallincola holothuriorum]|uniref:DUF3192 domain-containing protein n=1 Tax=Corallincola holothuriorum TaxID=2282215 RepID=A0A368NMH7_9GAMM|nr:DUF3192 domain-containing protein [Corallincola holothuriorum]RCU50854.1 DUF3192 domain-containing protein [Corallincola holothuriorum]
MKKTCLLLALALPLTLTGCVIAVGGDGDRTSWSSDWEDRERINREKLEKMEVGAAMDQVRMTMGTADFDEKLVKGDDNYRLLYYRTQRQQKDGITSKDECTPLVFKNGQLIGWGDSAVAQI